MACACQNTATGWRDDFQNRPGWQFDLEQTPRMAPGFARTFRMRKAAISVPATYSFKYGQCLLYAKDMVGCGFSKENMCRVELSKGGQVHEVLRYRTRTLPSKSLPATSSLLFSFINSHIVEIQHIPRILTEPWTTPALSLSSSSFINQTRLRRSS
ncbi:hypothetical protein BDV96DRAFT_596387 [Lophiotrema nucula]|uniref:Uncharacterized protein n=1 Tax=Lophiotrema nucula TaxID=690887 RepID=A0A6A5ZLG9_9PLEO|nr:hypothetical protein BDV96DRAFT_596387 [Lophiotrema nucula]